MIEEQLGTLEAIIGFKVNSAGFKQAQAMLKALEKQAIATGKAIDKAFKGAGAGSAGQAAKALAVAQKAQTQAQFQAQLQNAKMTKINNGTAATGLKTQQQSVALQIKQAQLAAVTQKAQAVAAKASLQQHAQALGHQIQQSRLANLHQQNTIRGQRAAAQQAKAARQALGLTNNHNAGRRSSHGGGLLGVGHNAIHRFGGVGRFAGGVANGGIAGGMEGLAGSLGSAATGLGAIVGSAALVVAAFAAVAAAATGFAREAERAANTRNQRIGQFESVGDKTPENAERMNARFENFSQTEGLSTKDAGESYAKLTNALAGKIGVDKAADATEGFMRFGVSQHLSNEDLQRSSLGARQAFGFGQLKAQETNQILEPLGAHGMEYAAAAWQKAKGTNLTGSAASKEFLNDRQDRKISGDMLTKWFTSFAEILNSHANDGGLLDKARQTQQANDNRMGNQYQANLANAYDNTSLRKTMVGEDGLYDNFVKFLHALAPEFNSLAEASSSVLKGVTGLIKGLTDLTNWWNSGKSFFDPKFMQDFSSAMSELGTSLSTLWNTVKQSFGIAEETGVFKTVGETMIGVITLVVDALTSFIDVLILVGRTVQDMLGSLPQALGGYSDDQYASILKQRKADDKARSDIAERRELDRHGGGPIASPEGHIDPKAPWRLTDGSDLPRVDATGNSLGAMSFPPATPLVQPAVNGQAAAAAINNVTTNTIHVQMGDTTISGVETDKVFGALDQRDKALEKTLQDVVDRMGARAAVSTQSQARGN